MTRRLNHTTYVIHGDNGQIRYVETSNPMAAAYRIGSAMIYADQTAHPAFREMIDTIQWRDVR